MQPLKGAPGHVLRTLQERIEHGQTAISYVDLSLETGYSVPTIQAAVGVLARDSFIRVQKQRSGRPQVYSLIPPELRRAQVAARLVNLIQ